MILVINICKEKLHYYEFVKPICDVMEGEVDFFVKNYNDLNKNDLKKADKVIICGTSLFDNDFVSNLDKFEWIKDFDKPILGICGGMQVIGLVFSGKLKRQTEIGFYFENFKKEFLGIEGKQEVYHLHNNYVDFNVLKDFIIFAKSDVGVAQAVRYVERSVYGVLFHPEVRNKEMILEFVNNG